MKFLVRFFYTSVLIFTLSSVNAQNIDIDLLKSINANETNFKNNFSNAVAQSVTFVNIGVPVGVFIAGLSKHDKQLKLDAAYIAGSYVLSSLVTQVTKRIVNRNRPFVTYPFIVNRDNETGGYSFPSGHASAAFCSATSLSLYFPKWYVIVPSYLWAASVGWARMYQGVHYPSDVLAGAVIGAGSAWLGHYIQHKMDQRSKKK